MTARIRVRSRVVGALALTAGMGLGLEAHAQAQDQPQPEVYRYNLLHFPKLGSCQGSADWAARRFAAVTGITPLRTTCREPWSVGGPPPANSGKQDTTIEISYEATHRLPVATNAGHWEGPVSSYGSREACQADLNRQAALFTRETGLTAAFAFCFWDNGEMPTLPWNMRIDGFGRPKNRAQSYVTHVGFTRGVANEAAVAADIARRFAATGVAVAQVFFRSEFAGEQQNLHVNYYAAQPQGLWHWQVPYSANGECEAMLPTATQLFASRQVPVLGAFCSSDTVRRLNILSLWSNRISVETYALGYETWAECHADEARVLASYRTRPRNTVYGTLCAGTGGSYRMHLFADNPNG